MILFSLVFLIGVVFSLRYNWWRIPVSNIHPRVLMYHKIDVHTHDKKRNKWRVECVDFAKQMAWFSKNGWHSFTMSELVASQESLPPKSFAITFDDGYEDNYTHAFAILQKYQFKATIYLVPQKKENDWELFANKDFDKLLSTQQIQTMQESGLIEFGAHTMHHSNLTRLDDAEMTKEIEDSKKYVETISGQPCYSFAYPYGKYNDKIVDKVKQVGYESAVSVKRGIFDSNFFEIKRVGILGTESFFDFYLKVTRIRNKL